MSDEKVSIYVNPHDFNNIFEISANVWLPKNLMLIDKGTHVYLFDLKRELFTKHDKAELYFGDFLPKAS